MQPLLTPDLISRHLGIPVSHDEGGGVAEKTASGGAAPALTQVLTGLGRARYDAVLALEVGHPVRELLEAAAARLALAAMLPTINIRALPKGGLVRATGWGDSREELTGPFAVAQLQRVLTSDALAMLAQIRGAVYANGDLIEPPDPAAPIIPFIL